MKITALDILPIRLEPIKVGYRREDDLSTLARVDTVLIRLRTDTELVGLGEAATIRSYFNQSLGTLLDWLRAYREVLIGCDPLEVQTVHRKLDLVSGEKPPGTQPARAAIDMALIDLAGKAYGCPAYRLLGGAYRLEFELLTNLYEETVEAKVAAARAFVEQGFTGLKVKIGDSLLLSGYSVQNMRHETSLLRAVLEAVPEHVYVDADSNQGWGNAKYAVRLVEEVLSERFYPNLAIEQPLHHLDFSGHGYVRAAIPVPLILDESVTSPEAMLEIVKHGAADRIVLKMNRVGGFANARRIVAICEAAGIGVSIDTMPFTKLGDTAHAHLAATLRDPYPIDAEGHLWFADTPVVGGIELKGGRAHLSDAPGLGVELDEAKLEAVLLRHDGSDG